MTLVLKEIPSLDYASEAGQDYGHLWGQNCCICINANQYNFIYTGHFSKVAPNSIVSVLKDVDESV